jgi:hypothetical protein
MYGSMSYNKSVCEHVICDAHGIIESQQLKKIEIYVLSVKTKHSDLTNWNIRLS